MRDWTVTSAQGPGRVTLAPHVTRVRPGVPLRTAHRANTWEISPTLEEADLLAAENAEGGATVNAWQSATFNTHLRDQFNGGDRLDIDYIDDNGIVRLKKVKKGPILATDNNHIIINVA